MTERIRKVLLEAISESGLKANDYPIRELYYEGKSQQWFTWNIADQFGDWEEDGIVNFEKSSIQIHLFTDIKTPYEELKKNIKNCLVKNGFSYPEMQTFMEQDTLKKQIVFSCEIATGR